MGFSVKIPTLIKGLFWEIMPSALLAKASIGLLRHFATSILAASFLQCHFDSQNHSHFPFRSKPQDYIDHIAVLADSSDTNLHEVVMTNLYWIVSSDFVFQGWCYNLFGWQISKHLCSNILGLFFFSFFLSFTFFFFFFFFVIFVIKNVKFP